MDNNEMRDAPMSTLDDLQIPTKTLGQLGDDLEFARRNHAAAISGLEAAKALVKETAIVERDTYKAFNDAVAAMKPKRKSPTPRAPKAEKPKAAPKTKK